MNQYKMDLSKYISDNVNTDIGLDLQEKLKNFKELSKCMKICISKGIVHRDIKPDNIFVDSINNKLVVADFGISKQYKIMT